MNSTLRTSISMVALALVLAGCLGSGSGGGTNGNSGAGSSTPISSPNMSSPAAGAASVTLYWSGVYPASSYNLYWSTTPGVSKANGNKVAGVVSPYNHTQLSNGTTYYYVVTAIDGAGAESAESSQVSARPVGWSDGSQVGQLGSNETISPYSVQINDTGTAVATWSVGNVWGESTLYANVRQGGAWLTPVAFGSRAYSPSVALTASGDAIAVYSQPYFESASGWSGIGAHLRTLVNSRRYNHRTGAWSAARPISVNGWSFAGHPDIAVDSNGNAIAIWDEDSQIWARRFDAALGAWETSATNLSVTYVPHRRIVVDGSNIFTFLWVENSTVYARRFNATPNTWDASIRIGHDPAVLPGASDPQVDVNNAGNVFVVWQQGTTLPDNTTRYSIDSSSFDPVTNTWSAPATLTASASLVQSPRVAVDNAGNAMAAWLQTGTTGSSLQTARFAATGSTWSAPMLTDQTGTGTIASIVLGMDGNGNAEVIWLDPATGIVERRFDAATSTWSGFNTTLGPKPYALMGAMSDSGYIALLGDATVKWSKAVWGWILTP